MYTTTIRNNLLETYAFGKGLASRFLRFNYPHDYTKPIIRTNFPGPKAVEALQTAGGVGTLTSVSNNYFALISHRN